MCRQSDIRHRSTRKPTPCPGHLFRIGPNIRTRTTGDVGIDGWAKMGRLRDSGNPSVCGPFRDPKGTDLFRPVLDLGVPAVRRLGRIRHRAAAIAIIGVSPPNRSARCRRPLNPSKCLERGEMREDCTFMRTRYTRMGRTSALKEDAPARPRRGGPPPTNVGGRCFNPLAASSWTSV